jgi:hypothetical protein
MKSYFSATCFWRSNKRLQQESRFGTEMLLVRLRSLKESSLNW